MTRKKNLILLFGSILLALTLVMLPAMAGCGEATTPGEETETEVEAEVDVETGLKVVKLVRQDNYGAVETQIMHNDKWEELFEEVANKYGYTFEWEYYWNNALYSPEAAVEAVGMGGQIFNIDWWNQFPPEMQDELSDAIRELNSWKIENVDWIYRHETGEIIKGEMQVTRLTAEEFQRWRESCREPVWDWWSADVEGGAEAIASAEAMTPDLDAYFAKIDSYLGDSLISP